MKTLILGATGPTGRHVLANALKAGDTVSVLARHPEALADVEDRITVFQGDATLADDVARAAEGQDVVIVTLGRGRSLKPEGLFTGAATAVVEAMQRTGVKRLVWLSAYGVGETIRTASRTAPLYAGSTPTRPHPSGSCGPAGWSGRSSTPPS